MTLNFPANPTPGLTYEAPNGVTYIWNDSVQSWVVESVDYDGDYVNITGDQMRGPLDFSASVNDIGIWWGSNPKIRFDKGGTTEFRGNFSAHGRLGLKHGLHFDHPNEGFISFGETANRIIFTNSKTTFTFGTSEYLQVDDDGVTYLGNFIKPKNVTTVEYVANEISDLQTQIDLLNYDLTDKITDVIKDTAVLLTGTQTIDGAKKFIHQIQIDRGEDIGANPVNSFIIKGNVGGNNNRSYSILLKDYRRPIGSDDSVMYFGATSNNNDIVNKQYVTNNTLTSVSGTSGKEGGNDTGVRVRAKDNNGNQEIYMMQATISQYGANRRGLLPQGNGDPNNADLATGQMYFNKSTKRVLIRVN